MATKITVADKITARNQRIREKNHGNAGHKHCFFHDRYLHAGGNGKDRNGNQHIQRNGNLHGQFPDFGIHGLKKKHAVAIKATAFLF